MLAIITLKVGTPLGFKLPSDKKQYSFLQESLAANGTGITLSNIGLSRYPYWILINATLGTEFRLFEAVF